MKMISMLALIGVALAATPVAAQAQSNPPAVERADRAAKATIRTVYGAAGYRVCGSRCARASANAGERIYTETQKASRAGAERLQRAGQRLRERGDR